MARRQFTKDEMSRLRACPYVLDVTLNKVFFSVEFKELFWKALQEGKRPRDIVAELGVDPEVLGKTRINGMAGMIRHDAKAGREFRDLNTYNAYLTEYVDPEVRIKRLEQQLADDETTTDELNDNEVGKLKWVFLFWRI